MICVDPMTTYLVWGNRRWCHLFDDNGDLDGLHDFARKLKLKHKWFQQGNPRYPHYDISPRKRQKAMELGATEVSRRYWPDKVRYEERAR